MGASTAIDRGVSGAGRLALVGLIGLVPALAGPVAAAPDPSQQLDAEMVSHFRSDQPGAAVLVRKGDRILLRKGYGLAEVGKARAVRPEQVFRLGSITKPFTAAAIMILADEGKLSPGDDIRKHLPAYPTHGATITIEHLLTHTSGIPSYTEQAGFQQLLAQNIEPPALVARFKDLPLEFAPGSKMEYSNSGYHLLGLIIEKVSGKTYAEFLAQRIFSPLEMTHSGYGDDPKLDRVAGYSRDQKGPVQPAPPINMKIPYSAGALVSSVDDLARWDGAIRAGKLLKKASWERVFTPARLPDGRRTDYGYGWNLSKLDGRPVQRHGGGIPGFVTHFLRMPAEDLLVVVLMNSLPGPTDPGLLVHRLALIALGKPMIDPKVVALAPAVLDRYVGVYRHPDRGDVVVRREGDHLTVQPRRGPPLAAWPESERRFFVKGHPVRFAFVVGPGGAATELEITRPGGEIDRAPRTSDKPPD
jgi:D-alanyl-D-alanine carboxypeptidase